MKKIYLSLGGNLGNREKHLKEAIQFISERVGQIILKSSVYETKAWGIENQPDFLNQVIAVKTLLNPQEVLATILAIEKDMGRIRERKWYTRLIDIDLLFYEKEIIQEENLIVPHPFIAERNFVLAPLAEIAGAFIHPKLDKTIAALYKNCPDQLAVYELVLDK